MSNRWIALAAAAALTATACKKDAAGPEPVASVEVTSSGTGLDVGTMLQLSAVTKAADGSVLTGRTITWRSSNDGFATVDGNGLVRGMGAGLVTITATSEGRNGTAALTVRLPVTLPSVTTLSASAVTSSSVELNGNVHPNNGQTRFNFEYGTAASLGQTCGEDGTLNANQALTAVRCTLSSVPAGTTLYYRAVAQNSAGRATGTILTVTLQSARPAVVTLPATNVTSSGGRANGTVNPHGTATTWAIQWGTTLSLSGGNCTNNTTLTSSAPVDVWCTFSNVQPNTTIYYRVIAENSAGRSEGSILSFTTGASGSSSASSDMPGDKQREDIRMRAESSASSQRSIERKLQIAH